MSFHARSARASSSLLLSIALALGGCDGDVAEGEGEGDEGEGEGEEGEGEGEGEGEEGEGEEGEGEEGEGEGEEGEGEGEGEGESALDVIVDVPFAGPYGTHTIVVPAKTNWVNTGLFLQQGETATISATGTWSLLSTSVDATGSPDLGSDRGCNFGGLAVRSGLRYEDEITCGAASFTFTAPRTDVVYVGMIQSTDLGEAYGDRLRADGELTVTVTSDGDTVPSIAIDSVPLVDLNGVASGVVQLLSEHHMFIANVADVQADIDVVAASGATFDAIWETEFDLRGMAPFEGQRVRWVADDTISAFAYMLAGNPVRCDPGIFSGFREQRILRAVEETTDIWGFSHELGHVFSFANGTWVYEFGSFETWPNVFTLHALRTLNRQANQPNIDTFCDGRDAYLASGTIEDFTNDPFVQLCFFDEFRTAHGDDMWRTFFRGMNETTNDQIGYDGTDASAWRFMRDRLNVATGEDVTPRFDAWRVPLQ